VNSIFGRKTPGSAAERLFCSNEKGGPALGPAFRTGTVIANFSFGRQIKATQTQADEFLGRIAADLAKTQHALQHKRARKSACKVSAARARSGGRAGLAGGEVAERPLPHPK
jgi:hypothetical protein